MINAQLDEKEYVVGDIIKAQYEINVLKKRLKQLMNDFKLKTQKTWCDEFEIEVLTAEDEESELDYIGEIYKMSIELGNLDGHDMYRFSADVVMEVKDSDLNLSFKDFYVVHNNREEIKRLAREEKYARMMEEKRLKSEKKEEQKKTKEYKQYLKLKEKFEEK